MRSPSRADLRRRRATAADAPALVDLIRAAYRGPASYGRWTSEEHLVRGTRTDERAVLAAIESVGSTMLVVEGEDAGAPLACCRIADRGDGLAYFGMFAVDPARQGAGTGRQVVRWAELAAAELFSARVLELEVLGQQEQLRGWYERLGYMATGEIRPFPADPVFAVPMRDDLHLVVLSRKLCAGDRPYPLACAMSDLIATLETIVGKRHVLADADLRAGYETDWTGRWHGESLAVVRPADTREVAAVLGACAERHVAVVTQGGNTGLVGGATPADRLPEIVLSTRRLDALGEVDSALMQLPCGAGVTLSQLQQTADAAGLQAGLDLAARDSATVGGLASCNAGGLQAVRYGTARRRIAGLEAVLADGTVVSRMSGLRKDNAGYDLASLLIGSEGTLGVITRVLWSLVPRFSDRALALVAVDSIGAAVDAARALLARLPSLELLELIDEASIRLSLEHLSGTPPAPITPAWVLVGCASLGDAQEELAEALIGSGLGDDAVVAVDASRRQRLLSIRESLTETIAAAGIPHKLDIGVPLGAIASFLDELPAVVAAAAPDARTFVYGHLGDGNLHVNLLGPPPDDESADEAVLQLAAGKGGTITAEHGVGRHKPQYLSLVRSQAEIAAMVAIKRALDPRGILNPGVILA